MPFFALVRCRMAQKRSYKFTNKKHSQKAVMSTVFGALSLISLVTVLYLAYRGAGEAPVGFGVGGVFILIFAVIGLVLGVLAVQEKDKYMFFGRLGCILNVLSLLGISGVLYAGAYL